MSRGIQFWTRLHSLGWSFLQRHKKLYHKQRLNFKLLPLERGVRQGDPLSPYLCAIAVETLAIAIRQNPDIKGIVIGQEETKVLQYADDITATLADVDSAKSL